MDAVGKVDRTCAGGEVHHVALRREYEHLVVEHIHFEIVNEVLRVGVLLRFEQAADPGELLLISGADACAAGFVLPVRGDAVFADAVHLPGADLHLEHDALLAEDGRMHALVAVGLGRGNVVLEAARHGAEHVVDVAENIVAVGNIVHDDAERAEIEDLVQTALLRIHLAVNAVGMLDAALHRCADAVLREPVGDLLFDIGHELVEHVRLAVEVGDDLTVAVRVEIFEREVLELPLHLLQAEPVGDGRIDLHRFERLFELLLRDHVFHRAHIVQPVGDLDEDDADVLRHRHEHFAEVFHLLVLAARELHAGELCDALHDIGYLAAELPGDVLVGDGGVLNAVVQQRRDDAVLVQPHLRADLRGGDAVRHIRRAGLALLPAVGAVGQLKRRAHPAEIDAGVMFQNGIGKLPIALFNNFFCHDRSFYPSLLRRRSVITSCTLRRP